jgi:hypothetical protein
MSYCVPIPPDTGAVDSTVLPESVPGVVNHALYAPLRRWSGPVWAIAPPSGALTDRPGISIQLRKRVLPLRRSKTAAKQNPLKTEPHATV